jgi:predicted nucleotide-binding protein
MANRKAEVAVLAPDNPIVEKRSYISQSDIPSFSLDKALRIATAIGENYGYKPSSALQVAKALDITPTTGGFKTLTGASIAYGLTNGGYNADSISITPLGMRIVRPTAEGDDLAAKREALLKPRVIREFLQKYDGAPFPKDTIGQNVLMEMGVPQERTADALKLIVEGATAVGFMQIIKDRKYVELGSTAVLIAEEDDDGIGDGTELASASTPQPTLVPKPAIPPGVPALTTPATPMTDARAKRVFITHGKNKDLIEPIKKLLSLADLEPVVSVQTQTVSQPVPNKVMNDMRSCGAAIIHVDDERHITDNDGAEHIVLNDNVLIEIGAAMAIYGERFILIVKEGLKLPSNLSGLLELRYKGDRPVIEDTIKLIDAINDMKKRPLPL